MKKSLKILKLIHQIGYICLFIASIFSLVNSFNEVPVFKFYIIFPLLFVGIVGIVTGIICLVKAPSDKAGTEPENEENK